MGHKGNRLETPPDDKGKTYKHLGFNPNGVTYFPKRYTKRTVEPSPIDGPRPDDPNWSKGWGVPEGMSTPWGKGGLNPTTDKSGTFSDFDPDFPNGYYYDQYGNMIPAEDGQKTYIDKNGIEKPIKGKPDPYPHGYYFDKDGNKTAAAEGKDFYVDENGVEKPVRGIPEPFPNGYFYDDDGNKKAAEEGQDYYYDAAGSKKPVKRDYYPNGYYLDENGNKIPARDGQEYYYDADGTMKPVIKDHGYYFDEAGNKVSAEPGQETYVDKKGHVKQIRGKGQGHQTENPNPWADDPHLPDSWKGPLGPGFSGAPPPPYAYVPANYGKPSYCFEPPVKGKCELELKRFAYNPFSDVCVEFTYSGCSGSENNFLTKEVCETKCTNVPGPDCDPLVDDTIDLGNYMDVSRRCA